MMALSSAPQDLKFRPAARGLKRDRVRVLYRPARTRGDHRVAAGVVGDGKKWGEKWSQCNFPMAHARSLMRQTEPSG